MHHNHLNHLLFWQMQGQRNHDRLYRGGVLRRATLPARLTGRMIAAVGRMLAALGERLQGDEITVLPRSPQPAER